MNASCIRFFSFIRPHGPIVNKRFRLAVAAGILRLKYGFGDKISSDIDSFLCFYIACGDGVHVSGFEGG